MKKLSEVILAMDAPSVSCGKCHFTAALTGEFSFEDGRLVFRAAADPQPRRGPDFSRCGECGAEFTAVSWDWGSRRLTQDDLDAIQDTLRKTREKEWDDREEVYG